MSASTPRQLLPYKHARPPFPVETLYGGDTIAYYSRAFVCGDKRGYRVAVIVRIDRTDEEFPVQLDTGEPLPLTNKMKRIQDRFGNKLESENAKWRSLCSYRLVDGSFDAPTRSIILAAGIRAAVADSFTTVLAPPSKAPEKSIMRTLQRQKKLQRLMNTPKMKKLLAELKERRPIYQAAQPAAPVLPDTATVAWPTDVDYISECINDEGIRFKDACKLGICQCVGDCFRNECHNAIGAVYCTPANCKLDGNCSNFPREAPSLRLFQTRHAGLGVYTTQRLKAGDIIGEYCGVLHGYEGQREGQPPVKKKENSGYTMLLNHRSSDGKFVYIEPAKRGSYMRFLNHSCSPNAEFVEMQYRTHVRVVVVMLEPAVLELRSP